MGNKIVEKITSKYVVLGIQTIVTVLLIGVVWKLNVLPTRYFMIFAGILGFLLLIFSLLISDKRRKSKRTLITKVISIILSIVMLIGSSSVLKGSGVLDFITGSKTQMHTFSIVVMNDSPYTEKEEMAGKVIGANTTLQETIVNQAITQFKDDIGEFTVPEYADYGELSNALYAGEVDAIILYEAYRGNCEENHENFSSETRIIEGAVVNIEEQLEIVTTSVDVASEPFTIYISGIDTYGSVSTISRSDVNMLMTVNPNTRQILLTSIPRDYYVPLATSGVNDKLTHSGIYGINESIMTIENLFGIDVNYSARVNFTSLIQIVDALGGVDVYSDLAFTPRASPGTTIQEGMNHMDGETALAFSRERYAYESGDRHRVQNQQAVLTAILNKMMSSAIITNYSSVLESVKDSFETNMDSGDISALIRKQLDDGSGWTITQTQVDGVGSSSTTCYSMPGAELYVMIPDQQSIEDAKQKIADVMAGNPVTE